MKARRSPFLHFARSSALGMVITLAAADIARAADFIWDGGGADDLWGTSANWLDDVAPVPGSGNSVIFSGTTRLTPQSNYGDGDDFQNITFDSSAGAFTISNTGTNGIDWFGSINNQSGNTQTIGLRLYQSAGNAINATNGDIMLNSSALLFRNGQALTLNAASGKKIQIDSVISDGGGAGSAIAITGGGTVVLNGVNTFTSGIDIQSGTLSVSGNNGLGANSAPVALNGGTLGMNLPGSVTNTHVITVGTSGGTLNIINNIGTGTPTYSMGTAGNLTGSGALTVTGEGPLTTGVGSTVLVLGNANTGYTGNLTMQDGAIIEYANAGGIGTGGTLTINNNGMLSANNVTIARNLTLNAGGTLAFQNTNNGVFSGNVTLNGAANVRMQDWWSSTVRNGRIDGVISGGGSLAVGSGSGSGGILELRGANGFNGGVTINSGGVVAVARTNGTNTNLGNGSVTVNSGGTLRAGFAVTSNQNLSTTGNNITLAGGAIYADDGWQTLGGTINVTTSGFLGSTYNSGANTAAEGAKGLAISGLVTGSGALTIQHSRFTTGSSYHTSFVSFSNNSNTYSGTVTVNQNTTASEGGVYLGVNGSTALQHATVNISPINGTNLKFGASPLVFNTGLGSATIGAIGGSAPIVLTGYNQQTHAYTGDAIALTLGGNNASTTLSGVISGQGGLNKSGTGTLTLSGSNTFTGSTTISGGILKLGNTLALQNSALNPSGAGSLDVTGFTSPTIGGLTGGGNLATAVIGYGVVTNLILNPNTGTTTYSGIIADGATGMALTKTGAGTQVLGAANSYTGATNINAGILNLGHADALAGGGDITFGGGTLQYSSGNTTDYSARIANSIGAVLIDTNAQTVTFGSALPTSNTGGLTKNGAGTLVLTANNSYVGATTVNGGTLQFNGSSAVSPNSNLVLNNGSALALRSDTNAVFAPSGTSIASGASVSISVARSAAGTNQLLALGGTTAYSGSGTLNVSGANGYTLRLNAVTAGGAGTNQIFNVAGGNHLEIGNMTANTTYNVFTFSGAGNTLVDGAVTQIQANRSLAMVFNQTGTVTLSGNNNLRNNSNASNNANTYINLNSGTTNFNSNNAVFSNFAAPLNINASGGAVTIDNTSGAAVTLGGSHPININANFNYGGTNDLDLGNQGTTLNGAAGARTITTHGSATLTLSGAIANGTSSGLTKEGLGTLRLTGNSTYTGATTVNAGTFLIHGNNSVATGVVTIASGARLGGIGTIGGATTVDGTLAPGNSPGIMNYGDDLTLGGTAVFEWELFSLTDSISSRGQSSGYDAVNIAGDLSIDGMFRVLLGGSADFGDAFWQSDHTWAGVFDVTGSTADNGFGFELWDNGAGSAVSNLASYGSFSFNSTDGSIAWTAVPEPGKPLAFLLIGAGLLCRRRCRK